MTQKNANRKRALVVEDEAIVSRICQKTLQDEGFEVDVATNGLVAMKMLSEKSYDLCFSDIKTPAMSGIELYLYIQKEHPELAERVIFTSGDVLSSTIDKFLKEVNRPFLPKPFTPDELKEVVRKALMPL